MDIYIYKYIYTYVIASVYDIWDGWAMQVFHDIDQLAVRNTMRLRQVVTIRQTILRNAFSRVKI